MSMRGAFLSVGCVLMLFLAACSHIPRGDPLSGKTPARLEFLLRDGGITVACTEEPQRPHAAPSFYKVTRFGADASKTVRKPMRPTRVVQYGGSKASREIPRPPRLNARLVMDAAAADAATLREEVVEPAGSEPMNILPAFVLASPFLAVGAVAELAREPLRENDPIGSLLAQGVRLGMTKTEALRILKRRARVHEDGIGVGPGWGLRDQSAWLEFQNGRLAGLYTGEFYPLER